MVNKVLLINSVKCLLKLIIQILIYILIINYASVIKLCQDQDQLNGLGQ